MTTCQNPAKMHICHLNSCLAKYDSFESLNSLFHNTTAFAKALYTKKVMWSRQSVDLSHGTDVASSIQTVGISGDIQPYPGCVPNLRKTLINCVFSCVHRNSVTSNDKLISL